MKLKKTVLFLFLFLLPYSCGVFNNTINFEEYPINSTWIYHYSNEQDSIIVYIDRISLVEGIIVRDTKVRNDTTIFGRTKKTSLFPIK